MFTDCHPLRSNTTGGRPLAPRNAGAAARYARNSRRNIASALPVGDCNRFASRVFKMKNDRPPINADERRSKRQELFFSFY
jgi:hypothetical protein